MAYMIQKTTFGSILLFLLSVPIAIGANVFRIVVTGLGAYFINPKLAEGFLHEVSGLIVFLVGFISLAIAGTVINWIGDMKDYYPVIEDTNKDTLLDKSKEHVPENEVTTQV